MSESAQPKARQDNARIAIADDRLDQLIQRAQGVIAKDTTEVPDFWKSKYKKEAAKNWDLFYKRNTTKFFKGIHCIPDQDLILISLFVL
jgi:methyltransferase-like protein 6